MKLYLDFDPCQECNTMMAELSSPEMLFADEKKRAVYFLSRLASDIDGLFYRLGVDLEGYNKVKNEAIESMKKPIEDDIEEFY